MHQRQEDPLPKPAIGKPLKTLWVGLTRAAENHNGLVRILTDRLSKTAGLGPASSSREPDLAALLEAKSRLLLKQKKKPLQSVRED